MMAFQIQVTGLDPVVKAITRAAIALEGILLIMQSGASDAIIQAIESNRAELKTSGDELAAAVAAQTSQEK
jgi:hypothetical protein